MKLAICTPLYGLIDHDWLANLDALRQAAQAAGWEVVYCRTHGCALLTKARCHIAHEAWTLGHADVSLWIDADLYPDPAGTVRMLEACTDFRIVGAPCLTKQKGGDLCQAWKPEERRVDFWDRGGLVEIDAVGLGCTAVHGSVYARLAETPQCSKVKSVLDTSLHPFFQEIFVPTTDGGELLWSGEDYGFCCMAREAGCSIWCDTRVRTGHKGAYFYRVEDGLFEVPRVLELAVDASTKHVIFEE